ncbi:MAG: hypothetical protein AAF844_00275 [Pseudomonadota bacterium]
MDQILLTTSEPHPLERVPEHEAAGIERVVALQTTIMKTRQDPRKRGQHPKQQAVLRGVFEISEDVPRALRAGLFARPSRYDAAVRFSTGPMPRDCDPNPHAIAIKLFDVPGSPSGTQDFIALDQPTFFIRDIADYVTFFEGILSKDGPDGFWRAHPQSYALNLTFNVVIASHLDRQYWCEVPVAMDGGAARFTVIPDIDNASDRGPATTDNGLRDALRTHFIEARRPARFLIAAQAYVDEATTPIEDATSVWPTPFETVATLTIPAQDFLAEGRDTFGEALSFTPWHCLPAHRPLGGIQRARRRVYEESARLRRSLTGSATAEPNPADFRRLFPLSETANQE